MYCVRARSVCRIERRRFRFGLCVAFGVASPDEAARSSIVSILIRTRQSLQFFIRGMRR
jgi:hypothetical protein